MKEKEEVVPEFAPILTGRVGLSPHDAQAQHDYPTLMQLLLPRFRDDKRMTREAGVLTLRMQGSLFQWTLMCPTEGVQTTFATVELADPLLQIEDHVSSTAAVWTPTYDAKKRQRRGLDKARENL